MPSLQMEERCVTATGFSKIVVAAVFDDMALLDGDDAVAIPHCRKPMRDDHDRAALSDLAHILMDDALAFIIESAGGFIEYQDARVRNEGPRNCYSLALSA